MKSVKINGIYKIMAGVLMGWDGKVIAYDAENDKACISLDGITTVEIKSDYIEFYSDVKPAIKGLNDVSMIDFSR